MARWRTHNRRRQRGENRTPRQFRKACLRLVKVLKTFPPAIDLATGKHHWFGEPGWPRRSRFIHAYGELTLTWPGDKES